MPLPAARAGRLRRQVRHLLGLSPAHALCRDPEGRWSLRLAEGVHAGEWHTRLELPGIGWWLALRAAGRVHWCWIARKGLPVTLAARLGVALRADGRSAGR